MRFSAFLLLAFVACGDNATTAPSGGSSGVPNNTSSSSSSSGGGSSSSGSTPKDAGKDSAPPPSGPGNVRIMAANISSGDKQSYDPGEGARIFQGLKPDIVMIQEFNYGDKSDDAIRGFVTATFGADFDYFRESGSGLNIPNGIIPRYPILESGRWPASPDRGFVYAKLQVPGAHVLWAVSVHLPTAGSSERDGQAQDLVSKLSGKVGADDYLVIGGDFNTDGRGEACLGTVNAIVDATNSHAADNNGNENTNAPRNKPYDWVLGSPSLVANQIPTVIGQNSFEKGLVFDSSVYTPLTDVAPVEVGDSKSLNMQHMAIVKDFYLP